jgi:hypothetical protein
LDIVVAPAVSRDRRGFERAEERFVLGDSQAEPRSSDCLVGRETIMGLRTLRPRVPMAKLSTATLPRKTADPFYLSREWIELRDRVRREASGRCQAPGCGRRERRMFVDHIVELKDGGAPLDRANVWLLCGSCHTAKTYAARGRRFARPGGGSVYEAIESTKAAPVRTHRIFPGRHNPKAPPTAQDWGKEG